MELKTYLSIINRRKWIIVTVFALLLVATVIVVNVIPLKYTATAKLRVLTPQNGGTNYVGFDTNYATRLMNTYVAMASSTLVADQLKNELKLSTVPTINAAVIADSELIKITVEDRDPQISAAIANSVANILVLHSNQAVVNTKNSAETVIGAQLKVLANDVSQARAYYNQLAQPFNQNNVQITQLNNQLDNDQRLYLTLKDRYESANQAAPGAKDLGALASLQKQLSELQAQIIQEQKDLGALNAKIATDSGPLSAAQGTVNLKEQEYSSMLMQLDQVQTIQTIQETNQLILADQAVPPTTPSSPNFPLTYALAPIFALFLAVLMAFLVDHLDERLLSTSQIESVTKFAPLGKMSISSHADQLNVSGKEFDYQTDINRLLLNIQRISKRRVIKSLLISNTDPSNGKPVLGVNLAIEYARSGYKVLVIDANNRLPSVHQYFLNLKNDYGLSQVLSGKLMPEQVIKESGISNLYVMAAGPLLVNPGFYLGSTKMKELIAQLENGFNMVIINAAPISSGNESDELVTLIDGVILMIERGRAHIQDVMTSIKHLSDLDAPFIGYVVNHSEPEHLIHYIQQKINRTGKISLQPAEVKNPKLGVKEG